MKDLISPDVLRQLLDYSPETGELFWKRRSSEWFSEVGGQTAEHICRRWNSRFAGKEAFSGCNGYGYRRGRIFYQSYLAHRVIWAMWHGSWPAADIDHINLDRSDNRISNLRAATRSENNYNTGPKSNNTSGYKGVSLRKDNSKWGAEIQVRGKRQRLGCFDTPEEAHAAYCAAAERLHGEFARAV